MTWLHFLPLLGRHRDATPERVKKVKKSGIRFEDLARIAQKSRTPCGKQAFSKRGAMNAARDRSKFVEGRTFYPTVCFDGCGRNIFHLTTRRPHRKMREIFEARSRHSTLVRKQRRKRARAALREQVCVWEGEGGSYGD